MQKKSLSFIVVVFSLTFFLLPRQLWADFLILFIDGGQVTVRNYAEEGKTIKIYTPQGIIGFRKDDVEQIAPVDTSQSLDVPLETVSTTSLSPELSVLRSPLEKPETTGDGETTKTKKKETANLEAEATTKAGESAATEIERIDNHYQDIEQRFTTLWEKHLSDMDLGASDEVLAENRHQLEELDRERHELIDTIRRVVQDDLPPWAQ